MALSYIPPQVIDGKSVIKLDKIEVERETSKWKCASIVYVLGESPGYNTMHRYISQTWTEVAAPEIFMHEKGYFIVRFQSVEDMQPIMFSGPYSISNKPLILKNWTKEFDFDQEFPTKIPIWVKFPSLLMNCWGCDSLSRIASAIGILMFADECTTKQMRVSFARMLVEVDVTKTLPEEITFMDPNRKTIVHWVKHDLKPIFYQKY
ncbi:hypothetical protein KY289_001525 [Solanum tuberosum]|uniref:Endonuclease/exonuclease/phosphatase n=1 Tax=Solanum tuberosum TaxID=4113 RepID=M1CJB7_SOLTU|nr:hypothetical protein KY289_001525 [Solanum tuberosum]